MWRPKEGWDNPFNRAAIRAYGNDNKPISHHDAYEAGADAILKALKEDTPRLFDTTIMEAGIKLEKPLEERGAWYFIPDEAKDRLALHNNFT